MEVNKCFVTLLPSLGVKECGDLSMNRHVYTTWTPLSSYSGKGTEPLYCMQDRIVDRR